MQIVANLKFNDGDLEDMFPAETEEGQNVKPSMLAAKVAADYLGVAPESITWHAPDVFAVRYGSSYVATAFAGDRAVRFHSEEGDFQEGDDK